MISEDSPRNFPNTRSVTGVAPPQRWWHALHKKGGDGRLVFSELGEQRGKVGYTKIAVVKPMVIGALLFNIGHLGHDITRLSSTVHVVLALP